MGELRADERFGTIPRMALASAERFGSSAAIIDGESVLSFEDVAAAMHDIAASLIARGVEPGDRVGLWAPNCAGWITAALGVLAAGAWLVPINTRYRGSEAAYVLDQSDAVALIVADGFMGTDHLAMLRAQSSPLRCMTDPIILPVDAEGLSRWQRFIDEGKGSDPDVVRGRILSTGPDDICDIIFTSGTTGRPKGVMLRHGVSLRCYESYNTAFDLREGDRLLITTPFFHCFGYKAGWMLSLMVGAATVPLAVFDPGEAIRLIEHHRVTHMPGAPTIYSSILDHPDRACADLSSLRVAIVSAASIPSSLVLRMKEELALDNVMTGYGLTENHALGAITRPDDPLELVSTSAGRLAPGITARVVDDAGNDVPHGEPGELLLGGYAHMAGYYRDDAATSAALAGGWLHTGDVATVSADGIVRITDRKKDMYIMGGFNVAPAEVEATLLQFAPVAAAAVIGVPDDRYGEVGVAFIVVKPEHETTADVVIAFARDQMANFKVPRRVVIVDALPTNATGKVVKDRLREMAAGARARLTTMIEVEEQ